MSPAPEDIRAGEGDCPDENALALYVRGELPSDAQEGLAAHLDECGACLELVAHLVRLEVPAPQAAEPEATLPRGTTLGRYMVVEVVGNGSMGVVYAAYDPELDRKVALKVVRAPPTWRIPDPSAPARLLREAQAAARLSHPNVVPIHDVGTYEGGIFFAMEFVRGRTLRQAVRGERSFRRIVELYSAAGEGLAAAHAAGIVHRDFKPDNVLVGDDGRVRVTDFGLMAYAGAASPQRDRAGTPGYMAPEHQHGTDATHLSDQYSFATALEEALMVTRAPTAVRRILERGRSIDPTRRFSSMGQLLLELERASRRFRPWELGLLATLLLATAAVWATHGIHAERQRHALRELAQAAERLPRLLATERELAQLRVRAGLESGAVLAAFASASDIDVALGLAPRGRDQVETSDAHETLRSADLPGIRSEDVALLVDARGRVIYDVSDPAHFGWSAANLHLIQQALRWFPASELWSPARVRLLGIKTARPPGGSNLLLASAVPVTRGQAVVGAALTGSWLAPRAIDELERASAVHVVLTAPDGAHVGDFRGPLPPPQPGDAKITYFGGQPIAIASAALNGAAAGVPEGHAYVWREVEEPLGGLSDLTATRWAALALCSLASIWALRRLKDA